MLCAFIAVPGAAQGLRPIPYVMHPGVPAAAARLQPFVLHDSSYGRPRRIWVYLPRDYDSTAAAYPLIVAFDGDEYRDTVPLPLILDTLNATRHAPPFVAVLIDNADGPVRIADLGNAPRMPEFLARQLMPWVRARYHVTRDPRRTIITGSSAGGLAATYAALVHPELFGNVLSQSGAFWRGANASNGAPWEWLTAQVRTGAKRDIALLLDVGELEDHATLGGSGPNFRDANRRLRDALAAKGYRVIYTEVPGGMHGPQYWMTRLPTDIVTIISGW